MKTYGIRGEDGAKEHEGVANDEVEREDDSKEFTFEKAEDREGEVPDHHDTNNDDCKGKKKRGSEDKPSEKQARKGRFSSVPQPRRDLTSVELKFVVVGVFQRRESTPMIPETIKIAVSTHPKTP